MVNKKDFDWNNCNRIIAKLKKVNLLEANKEKIGFQLDNQKDKASE